MKEFIKKILKSLGIYHPLQTSYRRLVQETTSVVWKCRYRQYRGEGYECNFCHARYRRFVPEHPPADCRAAIENNNVVAGYGEQVYCPACLSKNRERLIKEVIARYLQPARKNILHLSPEKHLHRYLRTMATVTSVDLEPGFYRAIDPNIGYADATKLPFKNNEYDILIANHVLEHIPQDQQAMREFFRVLKPGGVAVLQVPLSLSLPTTIEDPFIQDPRRQAALYGQRDHVRIYSLNNYIERLQNSGFRVRVIPPAELAIFERYAIQENESAILAIKDPS